MGADYSSACSITGNNECHERRWLSRIEEVYLGVGKGVKGDGADIESHVQQGFGDDGAIGAGPPRRQLR